MFHLEHPAVVVVEKPQEVQVLGACEMVDRPAMALGEAVGRAGACNGFAGCLAHAIIQSCHCLLFLVSNSLFSLLP